MKLGAVLGERFEVQSLAGRGGVGAVYGGQVAVVLARVLFEEAPRVAALRA